MTLRRFARKLLKITGIITGLLVVLLVAFHFWFLNHAKGLLEKLVRDKSGGRVSLHVEKLRYNYFTRRMTIKEAVIVNTDTLTNSRAYRFRIPEIRVQLEALLPFILHKELLIDSLHLQGPEISVTKIRPGMDSAASRRKEVSIPYEMGKVYHSIQDALQTLHITRFQIDEGRFELLNRVQPELGPLVISRIHFHLDDIRVDSSDAPGKEKPFFAENLVLKSERQQIVFPDKRHRLNFSHFRINLKKKLVAFDSCMIEAVRPDSSAGSFRVFFDALYMTNIDFDTLYRHDVIKADSVYCINPHFNLRTDLDKTGPSGPSGPVLKTLIEQLTGNLSLNYVVVADADFDIRTRRKGVPSSFTFNHNNFEMQGLSIEQEAAKPIRVKSFAMAIRHYENFIRDSTYSVTFDSVLFKNDRVILSNFVFRKFIRGRTINTFRMPYFSLEGLSWDELVFEKRIKARRAGMYNPVIEYTYNKEKRARGEKRNLFRSLGVLNEYMDLDHLDIENGRLDLQLAPDLRIKLDGASLSVRSQSLLASKEITGLRNSLDNISFRKGVVESRGLRIELSDVSYQQADGHLTAGEAGVFKDDNSIRARLSRLEASGLQVDERTGNIRTEGLRWEKGVVTLQLPRDRTEQQLPEILMRNIAGGPTKLVLRSDSFSLSTGLDRLNISELDLTGGKPLSLKGCSAAGEMMMCQAPGLSLVAGDYAITDNEPSRLNGVQLTWQKAGDTARLLAPVVRFVPDLASILKGEFRFGPMQWEKPVMEASLARRAEPAKGKWPLIALASLELQQPSIRIHIASDSSKTSLDWDGNKEQGNILRLEDVTLRQGNTLDAFLGGIAFRVSGLRIAQTGKKAFDLADLRLDGRLERTGYKQEGSAWQTHIADLHTGPLDLQKLAHLKELALLDSLSLHGLYLENDAVRDPARLLGKNTDFRISVTGARYQGAENTFFFSNLGFTRKDNRFTLDSFRLMPRLPLDSFLKTRSYQQDYILLSSGAVAVEAVDPDTYFRDGTLHVHKVTVDSLFLLDYKDKNLPPKPGRVKPLPVNLLRRVPLPLAIDSVILRDGLVDYTEVNEKTKARGNITVNRLQVQLIDVRNHDFSPSDSLFIRANGYLLDTVWTRLRVKESYVDSEAGFIMTLRMKPGDLRVLNPSLVPLANVKLLSGQLDTLSMRAVGKEHISIGEMEMYYRNLRLQLMPDGQDRRQPFLTRLVSALANTFVIRSSNHSRTGLVFYRRDRDKSAINYLIRIAISGMSSSVGVKRIKREWRRYNKELEKKKLPAIEL